MQFQDKMHSQKMGFHDYIEALEEERKKIQVFTKELPLSLELVTQAIEACKQQMCGTMMTECNLNGQQSECSEQTSLDEGLVFEEFIPLKKRASTDFDDEEDDDEQHSSHKKVKMNSNGDKKKADWLRSVQLWNPNPPPPNEEVAWKTNVVELNRNGGAFQPFHKEEVSVGKGNESAAVGKSTTSAVVPTTSTTSSKKEEKGQARKQRRCWSQELHKRFLHALQQLGGADSATPKQIREQMNVDGLTNDEVKSHLQKFRLHTRRSPIMHNNANSQTAPLFLVGNIFVQPPPQEYTTIATTTTTTTVSGELTTITNSPGIYAPVATHPPVMNQHRFKQHSHSEERANNHSEGVVLSTSPASSSSTHTPTASHAS